MRRTAISLSLALTISVFGWPVAASAATGCPIQGEIPLAPLFANPAKPIRTGRLARQICGGAYVTLVTV